MTSLLTPRRLLRLLKEFPLKALKFVTTLLSLKALTTVPVKNCQGAQLWPMYLEI